MAGMTDLFSSSALDTLTTPATIARRWAAVQEHLHPPLAALAERVAASLSHHFPYQWAHYETSYKSQRAINRGRGQRVPIEEYHVAFDRPPRGAGIIISVSGAERALLVGLQLWGVRKPDLHALWGLQRAIWQPLVERIAAQGHARFAHATPAQQSDASAHTWLDAYLDTRSASYLWAGFVYPWEHLPDIAEEQVIADVRALFPLNEALMERAEERDYAPAAGPSPFVREQRAVFAIQPDLPPIERIIEHMHAQGLAMSDTTIRAYHVALRTRPLVILAGISGTGKTRLSRLYADALHHIASPAAENPHYLLVAVQPDWHNARDLLGYYNALTGMYHPTPFLRFLLRAAADPHQPYFVCLDEMNLARPEHYLAPLLSALETSERRLDLGIPAEEARTVTGELVRSPVRVPLNIAITGTVNVDESTYPLSDKLLDRANVIELTDVDLAAFRAAYQGSIDEQVWATITRVHAIVASLGQPFGYRTINEMLRYIETAQGVLTPQQALDLQIKQKVLPRLRGEDSPRLRRALGDLLALLLNTPAPERGSAAAVPPEQRAQAPLPTSAEKVRRMLERLQHEGFTDFYA
jgi:hypothetical protein